MMITMKNTFIHTDILKIFPRVKARTMISWSERGLIQPLQDASGRGSSRVYSYKNLIEIGIISQLLQYGISFSQILLIMRSDEMTNLLKKESWDVIFYISYSDAEKPNTSIVFDVNPQKEVVADSMRRRVALMNDPILSAPSAIGINVGVLKRYVDSMIKKL
jgi:DNA-binding transcriptional MerR regulator